MSASFEKAIGFDRSQKSAFAGIGKAFGTVSNSAEFQRIYQLPRRVLDLSQVDDATPVFQKPGGTMRLRPIQSAALIEASMQGGLLAPIAVGGGKTLIALCLPEALDSRKTVILVPAALLAQVLREIETVYSKHFYLPLDRIVFVTYHQLSQEKHCDVLNDEDPDLIVGDEIHKLKNPKSARTKRFLRFMRQNPHVRFCGLSGTLTNRSITEFTHLSELALRHQSPVPRGRAAWDWAGALDVKPDRPMNPGVLRKLCRDGEDVRAAVSRRINETCGVVASQGKDDIQASLVICRRDLPVPAEVASCLVEVNKKWSIRGEVFSSPLDKARYLNQLSCGFYYRWVWPDGVPDFEWLEARSKWHRAASDIMHKMRMRGGYDSLLQCTLAIKRGTIECPEWFAWENVRDRYRPEPPKETIWVSTFLLDDAIKQVRRLVKEAPTIVWYQHQAVGKKLEELTGWPRYGSGTDAGEATAPAIICSIRSQGTGKNLQNVYAKNIFTSLPRNGEEFEQTVGRTHRPGQMHDEVLVEWYGHIPYAREAMKQIIEDAEYRSEMNRRQDKVLYASHI